MDREWARPDSEGDPWHEYWEPEGSVEQRVQFGYEGPQAEAPAVQGGRHHDGRLLPRLRRHARGTGRVASSS